MRDYGTALQCVSFCSSPTRAIVTALSLSNGQGGLRPLRKHVGPTLFAAWRTIPTNKWHEMRDCKSRTTCAVTQFSNACTSVVLNLCSSVVLHSCSSVV